MTDRVDRPITPIHSIDDLVVRFHRGGRPRSEWLIGVEHEKIGVTAATGAAIPFSGAHGIEALLQRLADTGGWQITLDNGRLVALARGHERVSLEPGGQLELSGDPLVTQAGVETEISEHVAELRAPSAELGLAWLGLGFRPFGTRDDIEWVPKGRYQIMREALAKKGSHGHDMMKRTATVQANLDYADEDDAERKLRAAFSVTSMVTAIFAASPLVDGKDSGYQSYRARVWLDTDPDRCGLLPFAFERGGEGIFRRYTEWALDVPMLLLYRDDYRATGGITFRRFMREGLNGEHATVEDWDTHLSTLFPEARLKNYLEVRGADAGPMPLVLALPALWTGLLYDDDACAAAIALTAGLSYEQRVALRAAVPKGGFATPIGDGRTVGEAAKELLSIARAGLVRRTGNGSADLAALAPLDEIVGSGRTTADILRDAWTSAKGDVAKFIAAATL